MSGWDFMSAEERDGARFSWNLWPSSRIEATRIVVPVGCVLTPLKNRDPQHTIAAVQYDPIRCKNPNCGAILNPWCQVDFHSKLWTCPFCLTRNHFPPHYAELLSETNLPAELIPQYTTLEYELPNRRAGPPVFLFVVDTCLSEDQLEELKDSLQQCLNLLPDEALVGLVTFGTNVQLHELGYTECPKSFVFRGEKALDAGRISAMLGIRPGGMAGQTPSNGNDQAIGRFLVPVSECGKYPTSPRRFFQALASFGILGCLCLPWKRTPLRYREGKGSLTLLPTCSSSNPLIFTSSPLNRIFSRVRVGRPCPRPMAYWGRAAAIEGHRVCASSCRRIVGNGRAE